MAKRITNEDIMNAIMNMNTRMDDMQARIDKLETAGTRKAQPKAEKNVEFIKRNGEKVMTTQAQADAWEAARQRYDQMRENAPKETSTEGREWVKANPSCTRKEAKAHGFVGTKDDLKALKRELGVR